MVFTGKLYRLKCLSTNKQYIGSTLKPLRARLQQHEWFYRQMVKEGNNIILLLKF